MNLTTDAKARKAAPIYRGVLKYFPRALAAVAELSLIANEQHNPGEPLHWAKHKSTDHGDCLIRHQCDAGTIDTDKVRHSTKVAWRALAQAEIELEAAELGITPDELIARYKMNAEASYLPPDAIKSVEEARAWFAPRGPTVEETLATMPVCDDCHEHKAPEHLCPAKPVFKGNKESSRPAWCNHAAYTSRTLPRPDSRIVDFECGGCGEIYKTDYDPIFRQAEHGIDVI